VDLKIKNKEKAIEEISRLSIESEMKINYIQLLTIDKNHYLKSKKYFYF